MTQRRYKNDIYMYRKVWLSPFHNGKVEYFIISGSGDIEENASAISFTQTLLFQFKLRYLSSYVGVKL